MKKVVGLLLILALCISPVALAEDIVRTGFGSTLTFIGDPGDPALGAALAFIEGNAEAAGLPHFPGARYAPIRAYQLAWPAERPAVNQRVATEYAAYDAIYSLWYEVSSYAEPFTTYLNVGVGVGADGSMARCATPDQIIARTYDPQSFAGFRITAYQLDGIVLSGVTIYLPDENFDQLEAHSAEGVNSAVGLIEVLAKAGAVPEGTHVLSYDGETLDLSEAFGAAMAQTGTAGEYLMMGAVVNTMLTNLNLDEIAVTSAGQVIETGHAIYDEPLAFYESNRG